MVMSSAGFGQKRAEENIVGMCYQITTDEI
jgi:hypothetical protein